MILHMTLNHQMNKTFLQSKSNQMEVGLSLLLLLYLLFRKFDFQINLLTYKMTLNHQKNIRNNSPVKINVFYSQNHTKKRYYTCTYLHLRKFDLQTDLLTFKMTLNHQKNTRNVLYSQNHIKMRYCTCSYLYLLKILFFRNFDLQITS